MSSARVLSAPRLPAIWPAGLTLLLALALTGRLPSPSALANPFSAPAKPRAKAAAAPSGSMPDEFSVSPAGAATYALPLTVPPGTDGVQPALSFSYNSQRRDDGLLGPGWALTGLSAISRCIATPAQDGYRAGVSLGAFREDRLCLDGQRLLAVTGAYGQEGTVYHTEKDSYVRVVSHGRCGRGPCSFEATNKDGSVLLFGTTRDSAILAAGKSDGTRMAWGLKRFTTTTGNYVETTYDQINLPPFGTFPPIGTSAIGTPATPLEYHPLTIRYTGNDAAHLTPQREVRFLYTPRTDVLYDAVAGSQQQLTHRLSNVQTWVNDGSAWRLVLDYRLEYAASPGSGRALLVAISECGADGSCLPATRFQWQSLDPLEPAPGIVGTNTPLFLPPQSSSRRYVADFNGDGRSDIAVPGGVSPMPTVFFSNGDGSFSPALRSSGFAPGSAGILGDFDGDGRADFAIPDISLLNRSPNLQMYFSQGDGAFKGTNEPLPNANWFNDLLAIRLTGDFDGDGRTDFAVSRLGLPSIPVYFSNGDGSFRGTNLSLPGDPRWFNDSSGQRFLGDFNGDGMTDIAVWQPYLQSILVYFSNGDGSFRYTSFPLGNDPFNASTSLTGDFNGDGMTDFAVVLAGATTIPVYLSNGDGSFRRLNAPLQGSIAGSTQSSWMVGDFDGDGLADLALPQFGSSLVPIYYAQGDGSFTQAYYLLPQSPATILSEKLVGDWDGDGRPDFASSGASSISTYRTVHSSLLMTGIANGLGGTLTVEYAPMTDQEHLLTPLPVYPIVRAVSPLPLVRRYTQQDGRGNAYGYSYTYSGGRDDRSGHGFLGFDSVSLLEEASRRTTTVKRNWQFPLDGTVAESVVSGPDGVRLSDQLYSYKVLRPTAATWQALQVSERETHYTGGVPDFTLSKSFEHDAFGNLALVVDQGDPADPADDLVTCMRYSNDSQLWRLGYLTERQESTKVDNCRAFLAASSTTWIPLDTLSWKRLAYDGAMNLAVESGYDDQTGQWATFSYAYDAAGNRTSTTDPLGNVSSTRYDDTFTFPVRVESPRNQAGVSLIVSNTFEPGFGNLTAQRDPAGNELAFGFDPFGRKTSEAGPDPTGAPILLHTWASLGSGANSFVETRSRPSWDAPADPAAWPYERQYHDGMDRVVLTEATGPTASRPRRQSFAFDDQGRPSKESLPYFLGDPIGWVVTTYDGENRPTLVTSPDGTARSLAYDLRNQQVTSVEAAGTAEASTTVLHLDGRGRTVAKEQPDGGVVSYTYDPLGRLVQRVDGAGMTSTYLYTSLGHLSASIEPDAGLTRFDYDPRGLLVRRTGARNGTVTRTLTYTYDPLGRPISEVAAVPGSLPETTSFTYDEPAYQNGAGHLTSAAVPGTPGTTWHFGYDAYGETSAEQVETDGRIYPFSYLEDPLGRPQETLYPDGTSALHSYSPDGNLAEIRLREQGKVESSLARFDSYTALGQVGGIEYGNRVESTLRYFPVNVATGKLSSIDVHGPQGILFHRGYTWAARDRVSKMATSIPTPAYDLTFTYDAMGYLSTANDQSFGFVYDAAGDLMAQYGSSNIYGQGTHQLRHFLGAANQPVDDTFDPSGNLITRSKGGQHWSYTYDAYGRLRTAVKDGAAVGRFAYDFNGERTLKIDGDGTATRYVAPGFAVVSFSDGRGPLYTKTIEGPHGPLVAITLTGYGTTGGVAQGLYDRKTLAGWLHRTGRTLASISPAACLRSVAVASALATLAVMLLLASGRWETRWSRRCLRQALLAPALAAVSLLTGPGLLEASLVQGPNGAGIPDPGTTYFHQDLLGSTVLVTDASGQQVADLSYVPFGALDPGLSTGGDRFRPKFSGKELDAWTGFYYFGARYYDPASFRFLTPDPARQTASPYTYAGNNPTSAVDPDGELFFLVAGVVLGALVGAYSGGAAVNHDPNPANWDWEDARTYMGLFVGGVIGGVGGAAGVAFAEAGLAAGIVGEMAIGAGENAAFAAMGGGDAKEIFEAAGEGAFWGGLFAGGGAALGAAGSRLARRADSAGGKILETTEEGAGAVAGLCSSFVAGTRVETPAGSRPIEAIAQGDRVYSWNEGTGQTEVSTVSRTFGRQTGDLIHLTLDGKEVVTTPEHPFLRQGAGWTDAASLRPGDRLVALDLDHPKEAATTTVGRVERRSGEPVAVFNFEVAGNHDYYAGAGALVHNQVCTRFQRGSMLQRTRGTIDRANEIAGRRPSNPPIRFGGRPRYYRNATGDRILTFGDLARRRVRIPLSGSYAEDFARADRLVNMTAAQRQARQLTWHHVDYWNPAGTPYGYMELVPTRIHQRFPHSGGAHLYRLRFDASGY